MKTKAEIDIKIDHLYDAMGNEEDPIISAKVDTLSFLLGESDPITRAEIEPPKTDAELDNLIAILEKEKTLVPEYSLFGDPNWRTSDAMIEICKWAKGN